MAQWIERRTVNQGVASLIPSQGTCLGCGPGPRWGMFEKQPHTDVSLPFFLPPFPSLKINKSFKKWLNWCEWYSEFESRRTRALRRWGKEVAVFMGQTDHCARLCPRTYIFVHFLYSCLFFESGHIVQILYYYFYTWRVKISMLYWQCSFCSIDCCFKGNISKAVCALFIFP